MNNIVVIDSNTDFYTLIASKLSSLDLNLTFIQDPFSFIDSIGEKNYDLVIISHVLKGVYTPEFIKFIRNFKYYGKILVLSSDPNAKELYKLVDCVSPKCVDRVTLTHTVQGLLNNPIGCEY